MINEIARELTRKEKSEIRKLVTKQCANYDHEYGCLALDGDCYMLGKCYTGSFCKCFRKAVLPLNQGLQASLQGNMNTIPCHICGTRFKPKTNQVYCSSQCRLIGVRIQDKEKKRKQRRSKGL